MKKNRKVNVRRCRTIILFCILFIPVASFADIKKPATEIKNVLFIILDALRADHLGIYGYHRNTSPNIDRLGRKGVVFDRAIVQAGWTKPSMASYLTSTFPSVHEAVVTDNMLPGNIVTMADIFRHNGYHTYGFVNNPHLLDSFGFGEGFSIYKSYKNWDAMDNQLLNAVSQVLTGRYINDLQQDPGALLNNIENINLLSNGGFEEQVSDWECKADWLTADMMHSGSYAVHIDYKMVPSNFFLVRQKLKLKLGQDYIFGAYVKTKDIQDGVTVEIAEVYKDNSRRYARGSVLKGDNDWSLILGVFTPWAFSDNDDVEVELRVGRVNNFSQGEFWIDDAFILPVNDLPSFRPADKLFVYLHMIGAHSPYKPPPLYLNYFISNNEVLLQDKYDGAIRCFDNKLGVLFEGLKASGILDETLVIITADHGEGFGEHGKWCHPAECFYDETVRVPLIFYNERLFPSPKRVKKTVQASVDLLPSLVDILKLEVPRGVEFQGNSYFKEGSSQSPYAFFYVKENLQMITDERWKFFSGDDKEAPALFDLKSDQGEKNNVVDEHPEKVRKYRKLIEERIEADRSFSAKSGVIPGGKVKITDSMKKQLRALGYIN